MKKIFIIFLSTLLLSGCKKESDPVCVTWTVLNWQGKGDHTTVTTNYLPYNGEFEVCGAGKDTISINKTIIIDQAGPDLFNYRTFQSIK